MLDQLQLLWSSYRGDYVLGLLLTLRLTGTAFVLAMAFGTVLAGFRISPIAPLRAVGTVYVEIFRNIPLMSLILLVAYALPNIKIMLSYTASIIAAMSLVGASFVCEALRTGINTVDKGQIEAARSIGLGFLQVLGHVVFPQAFRSMVQPFVSILIGILLSSSLAYVVGQLDLTATSSYINNREALGLTPFIISAIVYCAIALGIAAIGARIEKRARVMR